MKRHLVVTVSVMALLAVSVRGAGDYTSENRKTFEKVFSRGLSRWHFLGLPLGGGVVGTIRLNEKGVPIEDRVKLVNPNEWFAENVSEAERKALNKKIVNSYSTGRFEIEDTTSRQGGANFRFPNLLRIIGLDASRTSTRGVSIKTYADKGTVRELDYGQFAKAYNKGKFDQVVDDALRQDVVMCFGDIQVTGLKSTITIDTSMNSEAKVKVGNLVDAETGLSLKVANKGGGKFYVESSGPLTVAYLFRELPKAGREVSRDRLLLNVARAKRPRVASMSGRLEKELAWALKRAKTSQRRSNPASNNRR